MTTAILPGTFHPVTTGHIDVAERAARLFDRVVVAVAVGHHKAPALTVEEHVHRHGACRTFETGTRNTSPRALATEETMNRDTLKGQWMQLKGKVRQQWGQLTDDDIDQMQGNAEMLVGRIQERYGRSREEAEREVDRWLDEQGRAA
jgi:cytidyltransferase-like protein